MHKILMQKVGVALLFLIFSSLAYAEPDQDPTRKLVFSSDDLYPCLGQHPKLGLFKKPNCEGKGRRAGSEYLLKTNSFGFRDKDYPKQKSPGVTRIMMIGPSNLFAPGIEEEQTIPRQLEKILNTKYGKKVEVINASNERMFTVKSYLILKLYFPEYNPDFVIHFVAVGGGITDDYVDHYFGSFENGELVSSIEYTSVENMPEFLREYLSKDFNRIKTINAILVGLRYAHLGIRLRLARSDRERESILLTPTLYYSKKIAEYAKIHNARFAGYLLPGDTSKQIRYIPNQNPKILDFFMSLVPNFEISDDKIASYLSSLNQNYHRISARFSRSGLEDRLFLKNDHHFSSFGSEQLAEEIAEDIAGKIP